MIKNHWLPVSAYASFQRLRQSVEEILCAYGQLLADAKAQPKDNLKTTNLDLAGGILLVNGDVEIKDRGSIVGLGTLVVTKKIKIKKESTIGDGITLIAGEKIELKENIVSSPASGNTYFSRKEIEVKKESQLSGTVLVLGDVKLKANTTLNALVYATGKFSLEKASNLAGSIIGGEPKDIKENTTVVYDDTIAGQAYTQFFSISPLAAPPLALNSAFNGPNPLWRFRGQLSTACNAGTSRRCWRKVNCKSP